MKPQHPPTNDDTAGDQQQDIQDYLDTMLGCDSQAPLSSTSVATPSQSDSIPIARPQQRASSPKAKPFAEKDPQDVRSNIAHLFSPAIKVAPAEVIETAPAPTKTVETTIEQAPAPAIVETSEETGLVDTAIQESETTENTTAAQSEWLANGRPAWAEEAFEALLFDVGGLTLAVPLVELGAICPIEQGAMTPLFGQRDCFFGVLSIHDQNIRSVDTANVVMPERYDPTIAAHYKYVLHIHGVDWGLAITALQKAVTIQPDDVKWRTARGKRKWLAGTVKERMCALLDVRQIAPELES